MTFIPHFGGDSIRNYPYFTCRDPLIVIKLSVLGKFFNSITAPPIHDDCLFYMLTSEILCYLSMMSIFTDLNRITKSISSFEVDKQLKRLPPKDISVLLSQIKKIKIQDKWEVSAFTHKTSKLLN